jgi:hypothetical protein
MAGKGRKGEGRADPPVSGASSGGPPACPIPMPNAPPAVPVSNSCAEGFPCNFWSFEDCFVNFKLFDVIFIYF